MKIKYDFHIHSCLSVCADDDMTPANIVSMAALLGYDAIAVSDHQSAKNVPAVLKAASRSGILAVPAMELCTREEVHVLCLFSHVQGALEFTEYVRARMFQKPIKDFSKFRQSIQDENDHIIGQENIYLGSAADIGIYSVSELLSQYGGVAVPAHIDRTSYSLIANLGFYDPAMNFNIFEVSNRCDINRFTEEHPELAGKRFIVDSDAHALEMMPEPAHEIEVSELSVAAIIENLKKK